LYLHLHDSGFNCGIMIINIYVLLLWKHGSNNEIKHKLRNNIEMVIICSFMFYY